MKFYGNAQHVDQQTYMNRVDTCFKCNHMVEILPSVKSCSLCGCFIKSKAKYKQSQCPDNPPRWLSIK
jgi:hypothetical protein